MFAGSRARFSARGWRPFAALAVGALAIALALAVAVFYLRPNTIGERRPPAPVSQDQASVVTVITVSHREEYTGSGFFISSDGRILTNAHVLEGADSISVLLPDGKRQRAYQVGQDAAGDVAEIFIPYHSQPLTMALGDVSVGAPVYVLGNPLGEHPNSTIKGRVIALHDSAVVEGHSYPDLIDTSAQVYAGNSGGPAVDGQGRVTGMLTVGDSPPYSPDGPGNGSLLPNSTFTPDLEQWRSLPLPSPATS